jgi:parallel beta-helix repeat protein
MKTLDQVEPRTPISSVPYTISSPGSYYLAASLAVTSGVAVTIGSDDVSLDLNGFRISNSGNAGGDYCVSVPNAFRVNVSNGILLGGRSSAYVNNSPQTILSGLLISGATSSGVFIDDDCTNAVIRNCVITGTTGTGIYVDDRNPGTCIEHNIISGWGWGIFIHGGGAGIRVLGNSVTGFSYKGIYPYSAATLEIKENLVRGNSAIEAISITGFCDGSLVKNNYLSGSGVGLLVYGSDYLLIDNNTIYAPTTIGVEFTSGAQNSVYRSNVIRNSGSSAVGGDWAGSNVDGGGNIL